MPIQRIIFLFLILNTGNFYAQKIGINTDGSTPGMMLDIKTSPLSTNDGIRINNSNPGNGDAIINFQNAGITTWTIGFDDDDNDALKIENGGSLTNNSSLKIETNGQIGINTNSPNVRLHINSNSGEDVFRLEANSITKFLMESNGKISIGSGNSPDDQVDIIGNVQIDQGYLKVGNPTATSTRKYAVQEFYWNGNVQATNNQPNFVTQNIGTFTIPNNIPVGTIIRVDKLVWEVDATHNDGNEDKEIDVRIGSAPWYGYFENVQDGPIAIDWHYVKDFGTAGYTFTGSQNIQFRAMDDDYYGSDYLNVLNMHVTVYYSYNIPLQAGDISSEGRIYANSNSDVGDLAEYFETSDTEEGLIIALIPGQNNKYASTSIAYDPNMIGVISANPSVVLNSPMTGPPVALAGRVKVLVKSGQPLIKSGDFLTSSKGGKAIIAKKAGPTIGFAVENQKEGSDKVEIIVQPGRYYVPATELTQNKEVTEKENEETTKKTDPNKRLGKFQTIDGKLIIVTKKN